ncbi:MAG: glycosyltransferase family 39 protein, partial [Acidobacteriota bacterium]|nr:glycosyltransferase family 39 protein [Acidobacteriota bacterium]
LPVTLFSFWALIELIRFSRDPDRPRHAVWFALLASVTILTKYSGAFICALPIVLLAVDRSRRIWTKPFFWLQPVLIGSLCAPWILYTHKLASVGLPPDGDPVHQNFGRAFFAFSSGLEISLGAVLSIAALLSIAFLSVRHVRTPDLYMYAATPPCLVFFLMLTPVGSESRYLLPAVPPLILLIVRAAAELRSVKWPYRLAGTAAPAVLAIVLLLRGAVLAPRYAPDVLRPVADYIVSKPQWKGKLIMLPPGRELPLIAEIAMRDSHRPSFVLLRPSKILSEAGWLGIHHVNYANPEDLQKTFLDHPIDLVILNRDSPPSAAALDRLMKGVVREFPGYWHREAVLDVSSDRGDRPQWEIYSSGRKTSGSEDLVFRQRTLKTLRHWNSPEDNRAIAH